MKFGRKWKNWGQMPSREDPVSFDPDQERIFDEVVLVAVNEGKFYPNKPAKAVDHAIREYLQIYSSQMREDARVIRRAAVKEVQRQWRSW